jgi:FMN-dependent oxidoreductase (nitrilotriacetate monooxygenase family)
MAAPLVINGFKASMVAHTTTGLWRHPRSQAHRYNELGFWIEQARTLEEFGFDALFIADALGVIDVYHGSADQALREGLQTPSTDPTLVISAMAAVTANLGFGVTIATSYAQPYELARRLSTLDHLTGGRIGWNVVTGSLDSAAVNLGLDSQVSHDTRYDIADEFLEVGYKLWESSWDDDAVIADRESGVYVDPARVRPIAHSGRYFQVPGIHMSEPSPQRTPLILQAGSSARGRDFAAKHAEVVFASAQSTVVLRGIVDDLRRRAELAGRDPQAIKILSILTVIAGETDEEARAEFDSYREYASIEGNLARLAGTTHVDIGQVPLDSPLEYFDTPGIQGILANFTKADPDRSWTPRQIAEHMAVSSFGPLVIGSPTTVADELERWVDEAGIDGFNLVDIMPGTSFRQFGELVVPELEARGRFDRRYTGRTYREHLFGAGKPRLPADHPGAAFRRSPTA